MELEQINENIAIAQQNLDYTKPSIHGNNEELERLNRQKLHVQTVIASMNTSAGYQNMQRIAESSAGSILTQKKVVLFAALRAIFQALKEEPRNQLQFLIYGSLSYPFYEPENGRMSQNYLQLRQAVLVQAAEETYNDLLAKAVRSAISSVYSLGSPSIWRDNRQW
jgi:hypothetical protein